MASPVQQLKLDEAILQSLKLQAELPRQNVSESARELIEYCQIHEEQDPMINQPAFNPFRVNKKCKLFWCHRTTT
jgi:hypothetical protein